MLGKTTEGKPGLNPVEKMLLGATPDDPVDFTAPVPGARAAQLARVRSFLAERPELREELAEEVEAAWQKTDGARVEFMSELAERRAQILTRAELEQVREQAPRAIAGFRDELSRYLVQIEGFGADGALR